MNLIDALHDDSVVIERDGPPVRDSTGSVVPGPPVHITVGGATVLSAYGVTVGSSSEEVDARMTVTTRRILSVPLGTDIRPADRVLHGGRRYQVIGAPLDLAHTSLARTEAAVEEVTG
ncbi:hypothetical protein [Streptomyces sp. DH12]|uniref:hypothetical protein n=1 Tax=Streptomyces sp. DH12 TaxID=2857010 RepID=UPI001E5C5B3F|nr:hypothetical protein [Streptomyces sp. DH12]